MAENKNAQQVREITDKLERGIKELFESERFKEYLRTMSKFYNYSFNNTLLIAMQKPEATYVAGYTSWQRNFDRQVMKGEKGIKILAPAPYKAQEEREKIDPATQKPVIGADGKAVTETVEVLRPAFKVVSVFDVSQTDGKELPDIIVDELKGTSKTTRRSSTRSGRNLLSLFPLRTFRAVQRDSSLRLKAASPFRRV